MVTFEKLAVAASSVGFTPATYAGKIRAVASVDGADIRFTIDGTTVPVAGSTGALVLDGDVIVLETREEIANFRAIRNAAVTANLQTHFENDIY